MATTSVLGTVYETLLCSPGMNEVVKIDVKMDRKTVLLLNSVIEAGLTDGVEKQELMRLFPADETARLREFANDCLAKAGLTELSQKIASLTSK